MIPKGVEAANPATVRFRIAFLAHSERSVCRLDVGIIVVAATFFSAVGLADQSHSQLNGAQTVVVTGKVTNANGKPISNAVVLLTDRWGKLRRVVVAELKTDARGEFASGELTFSSETLSVLATAYAPKLAIQSQHIPFNTGEANPIELRLVQASEATLRLLDENEQPVSGATIESISTRGRQDRMASAERDAWERFELSAPESDELGVLKIPLLDPKLFYEISITMYRAHSREDGTYRFLGLSGGMTYQAQVRGRARANYVSTEKVQGTEKAIDERSDRKPLKVSAQLLQELREMADALPAASKTLIDLDCDRWLGEPLGLEDLKGKPVLLYVGQEPRSLSVLQIAQDLYGEHGLIVIGILPAPADLPNRIMQRVAEKTAVTIPIAFPDPSVYSKFRLRAHSFLLYGPDGKLRENLRDNQMRQVRMYSES